MHRRPRHILHLSGYTDAIPKPRLPFDLRTMPIQPGSGVCVRSADPRRIDLLPKLLTLFRFPVLNQDHGRTAGPHSQIRTPAYAQAKRTATTLQRLYRLYLHLSVGATSVQAVSLRHSVILWTSPRYPVRYHRARIPLARLTRISTCGSLIPRPETTGGQGTEASPTETAAFRLLIAHKLFHCCPVLED
jgi:hypothetical protein